MKKYLTKISFLPLLGIIACSPMEEDQTNYNQQNRQSEEDDTYYEDGRDYGSYGTPYGPARRTGRRAGRRTSRRNY